jgi:iron complex outermembrane receptor protein
MLYGAVAYSEETNAVSKLEPITVYASRIESKSADIPAAAVVLNREDIETSGSGNLADLLSKKGIVDVHARNGNPFFSSIALRGFGENAFGRVKILLDGEEINNVDMAEPNLSRIPMDAAERIEVIHGPSPVLYGDGAVAGVVSVSTRREDYSNATRLSVKGGSWDTYGFNFRTKFGDEKMRSNYNASYDYIFSKGFRERSAYSIHTANAGARKFFDNDAYIGFRANYQNAFYELPGAITVNDWKENRKKAFKKDDWAKSYTWGTTFDAKIPIAADRWLLADGGFSSISRQAFYSPAKSEYDIWILSISPRVIDENSICGYSNKFTAGLDFRYDDYAASNFMDLGRLRAAVFFYEEFFLTEKFSLAGGVRLEEIENRYSSSFIKKSNSLEFQPDFEIAAIYRPIEDVKSYVKLSRFHRAPFCDEVNFNTNLPLDPESGYSADAGIEGTFAKEFSAGVDCYVMRMEDELFYDPLIQPWGCNVNSPSSTLRYGADTWIKWERKDVCYASLKFGSLKSVFTEGVYEHKDVPFVPNFRVRADAGVWILDDVLLKGGFSYFSSRYVVGDFMNTSEKLKGYPLFDLQIHYKPSWAKGWKVLFAIDNLFDRKYCDWAGIGYYYPGCGRCFSLQVSYEF